MFDIGFWELAILGVIGLIVLGPERLPVVARTVGRWARRARHYASALTTELENEISTNDIRGDVRRVREQIESETREIRDDAKSAIDPLHEPIEGRGQAQSQDSESTNVSRDIAADTGREAGVAVTDHKSAGDTNSARTDDESRS